MISSLRQISATGVPASACRKAWIICPSVNLLLRIVWSSLVLPRTLGQTQATVKCGAQWVKKAGAGPKWKIITKTNLECSTIILGRSNVLGLEVTGFVFYRDKMNIEKEKIIEMSVGEFNNYTPYQIKEITKNNDVYCIMTSNGRLPYKIDNIDLNTYSLRKEFIYNSTIDSRADDHAIVVG